MILLYICRIQKHKEQEPMKKKLFLLLFTTLMTLIFTSCGITNKTTYMNNFHKIVEDTENNPGMSDNDFDKQADKYEKYSGKYYEKFRNQLTDDDKKEIGRLHARFVKAAVAHGVNKFGSVLDDTIQQVGGFMEEIQK